MDGDWKELLLRDVIMLLKNESLHCKDVRNDLIKVEKILNQVLRNRDYGLFQDLETVIDILQEKIPLEIYDIYGEWYSRLWQSIEKVDFVYRSILSNKNYNETLTRDKRKQFHSMWNEYNYGVQKNDEKYSRVKTMISIAKYAFRVDNSFE